MASTPNNEPNEQIRGSTIFPLPSKLNDSKGAGRFHKPFFKILESVEPNTTPNMPDIQDKMPNVIEILKYHFKTSSTI